MLSYTSEDQFENYRSDFSAVVEGFNELKDETILGIQPVRLQLIETSKAGLFSEFLPEGLPMNISPMDVAIINQVELDEYIEAGVRLKIPVQ